MAATAAELGVRLAVVTRGAPALLVLDGFDRYLEDAGEVSQLLAAVANLTVLATSRAPLRLTPSPFIEWSPCPRPTPRRSDGRVVADSSSRIDRLVANLRVRAVSMWSQESTPSPRDRLLSGLPAWYRAVAIAAPTPTRDEESVEQESVLVYG